MKKHYSHKFIRAVSLILISVFVFTCNVEDDLKVIPKPDPIKVVKNPFSPENMQQALENISARSNSRIKTELPSITHNYVRFEPQNLDQIMLLEDLGYDLWDVPLDQEIEYEGDYYQQPGLPDSLNYFYTLIPANYNIVQSVPHTIISQVILFDEDAGDEQDPETIEDPWIPVPEDGICYDPDGYAYICGTDPRIYYRQKNEQLPEDLLKKTTKYLLENGINLDELYKEAMRLAGYKDELDDTNSSGRTQSKRYYPAGYIKVKDNSTNTDVPVKGVKVKACRYFKMETTYTDASGYFYVNKGYRQKARIIIKFKNDYAKLRGINGALKAWQYIWVLRKKLSLYEKSEMENVNYTFQYSPNAESMAALQFAGAHCLNTLYEIRQNCITNNINPPPTDLKIWISSKITQNASTPMLRSILNTSPLVQAINYLFPSAPSVVLRVVKSIVPDVTMRLQDDSGNTRSASNINGTFFHELGHSIHYAKVGNTFWGNLIGAILNNGGYGNKTSSGSGYVAVAESWAYFIGPTFNRLKYINTPAISEDELKVLEYQKKDDTVPFKSFNGSYSRGWIPWGMHHDLIDSGEPAITLINDQVSGYTINGIFKGFNSSSTTIQNLKSSILSNNGNSQSTQVNTLISGYGW